MADNKQKNIYALCVDADELVNTVKKVQFVKEKDGGFILTITPRVKDEFTCCTLTCVGNTSQAISNFFAKLRILEVNDQGQHIPSKEQLKKPVMVSMGSLFADVVATYADIEKQIFLKISENIVEASNTVSTVPIPIKEKDKIIPALKSEKVAMVLDREELSSALKYVSLAADVNSRFGCCYGVKPFLDGEISKLRILAMTDTVIVKADIPIKKVSREDFASLSESLPMTMIEATKLDQVLSVNGSDLVSIDVFFQNEGDKVDTIQLYVKTTTSMYMFKPYINCYPASVSGMLEDQYETNEFSIKVDAITLKRSLPVLGLGCDLSKDKSIELHVYKDHVIICDEGGVKNKGEYRETKIQDVETQLSNGEEGVVVVKLRQLLKSLKPYDTPITIVKASKLLVFQGNDERVKHGLVPCISSSQFEESNSE